MSIDIVSTSLVAPPPTGRYFEDFSAGLQFRSTGTIGVTAARIKSFANEFDPQPFHLDETAARGTLLGGLAASGWHTAAVAMRLIVESDLGLSGQGAGVEVESMRWLRPVHAGDTLRVEGTVTDTRPSRSRADRGIVKFRAVAYNQRNEAVLDATHVIVVSRRKSATPK
jgi:acyl dehydratase